MISIESSLKVESGCDGSTGHVGSIECSRSDSISKQMKWNKTRLVCLYGQREKFSQRPILVRRAMGSE